MEFGYEISSMAEDNFDSGAALDHFLGLGRSVGILIAPVFLLAFILFPDE
jgi:hypothetical protein